MNIKKQENLVPKKRFNLYLEIGDHEKLGVISEKKGLSRSQLVTVAIKQIIKQEDLQDEGINKKSD